MALNKTTFQWRNKNNSPIGWELRCNYGHWEQWRVDASTMFRLPARLRSTISFADSFLPSWPQASKPERFARWQPPYSNVHINLQYFFDIEMCAARLLACIRKPVLGSSDLASVTPTFCFIADSVCCRKLVYFMVIYLLIRRPFKVT